MIKQIPLHTKRYGPAQKAPASPDGGKTYGRTPPIAARTKPYAAGAPKREQGVPAHVKGYAPPKKAGASRVRAQYLPAYNFLVSVRMDGRYYNMGFSKVTGIESSIEAKAITEGGTNDRVYLSPGPATGEHKLVFEGGVIYSDGKSTTEERLQRFLRPGRRLGQLHISILDRTNQEKTGVRRTFIVDGAIVQRWSLRDLDAMSGQLQIQQFEVSYGKLSDQ